MGQLIGLLMVMLLGSAGAQVSPLEAQAKQFKGLQEITEDMTGNRKPSAEALHAFALGYSELFRAFLQGQGSLLKGVGDEKLNEFLAEIMVDQVLHKRQIGFILCFGLPKAKRVEIVELTKKKIADLVGSRDKAEREDGALLVRDYRMEYLLLVPQKKKEGEEAPKFTWETTSQLKLLNALTGGVKICL